MAQKRHPAVIRKEKEEKINEIFKKITPLINAKNTPSLPKETNLQKVYLATKEYIKSSREDGLALLACKEIYKLFHIAPYRKKDSGLTNLVKEKLRQLKYPQEVQQLNLFTAS